MNIKKHLLAIAQTSFGFNKRFGRRGPEWALDSEVTYQALKRIEELEKALEPFAKYGDVGLRGSRKDELVVGIYGINSSGEHDGIELKARHFHKAQTLLK